MKFTCRTEHLKSALSMLSRVVPAKPAKEILRAIKFTTGQGFVTIEGNDSENALRMRLIAEPVEQSGYGLLEFSKLRPIVDSFTEPETTIDMGETTCRILSGSSRFTLGCGRTDEFPAFPDHEADSTITINSGEWRDAIARLEPFSVPSAQYNWRGVSIESSDEHGVCAAACNDHGIYWEVLDAKIKGPDVRALVSERGSKLMAAVLEGQPGDCKVDFSASLCSIETPLGTAICRLNEGKFPDWRKIQKKFQPKFECACLREPLLVALTQATIPLTDASRRLNFHFGDNTLTLSANVAGEESEVKIPFAWEGAEQEFVYSGDLVKAVVQAFPVGAQIVIKLVADEEPMRLESGAIGFQVAGMERQK